MGVSVSDPYRVKICVHGFPEESCPLCGAEPYVGAEPYIVDGVFDLKKWQTRLDEIMPGFALADGWDDELCKSPEYQLAAHHPPAFWRKVEEDRYHNGRPKLHAQGVVIW